MISYTEVRGKVETYIDTNFLVLPVVFENTAEAPVNVEHIEVYDQDTMSESMDMANSVFKVTGDIIISIFTPLGSGTDKAKAVATDLVDLLTDFDENIQFSVPELGSVGEIEERGLYQHNLIMSYQFFYGQDDSSNC